MSRPDEQRIADILAAAAELERVVSEGKDPFLRDRILQRAAERLLEIIGEAANSLGPETTARHETIAWRDIARLRIVLAHHYHRVDAEQLWVIATQDIPTMVRQIEADGGGRCA